MASKGTEVLDPAALKAQHAIVYDINTSEIKDDIIQLLACFVSRYPPGAAIRPPTQAAASCRPGRA